MIDAVSEYGLACCHTTTAIHTITNVEGALLREREAYQEVLRIVFEEMI